jgi:DNA-binding NarL/FixJ family response regulator
MKHTPRENQVLDLLLQGCGNLEIAKALNLSPRTIKQYLNRLYMKHEINDDRFIKRVVLAIKVYQERRQANVDLGNIDGNAV